MSRPPAAGPLVQAKETPPPKRPLTRFGFVAPAPPKVPLFVRVVLPAVSRTVVPLASSKFQYATSAAWLAEGMSNATAINASHSVRLRGGDFRDTDIESNLCISTPFFVW